MSLEDAFDSAEQPLPRGTMVVLVRDVDEVSAGTPARVQEPWGGEGRQRSGPVSIATLGGVALEVPRAALVLQRGGPTPPAPAVPDREVWERYRGELALVTLVGSRAWNLAVATSDEDRRGCFLAPFEALSSLAGAPEQVEDPDADGIYWELARLIELALRADPNAIEALWGPVVQATSFGERILAARGAFLSRRVLDTFGRYALAQLERIEARERRNRLLEEAATLLREAGASWDEVEVALRERLEAREGVGRKRAGREAKDTLKDLARSLHDRGLIPDRHPRSVEELLRTRPEDPQGWLIARSDKPKNAMHLLRILRSGLSLLEGNGPLIRIEDGPVRDRLMAVRLGQVPIPEVLAEARVLAAELEAAAPGSPLPLEPDRAAAEALLRAGRRHAHPWAKVAQAWPTRDRGPIAGVPLEPLRRFLAARPERIFLAGLSGSHAYGVASPDSDVDLKCVHLASTGDVVGLAGAKETAAFLGAHEGLELDWTSHELGKAAAMLVRGNGNLLEWVLAEQVVLEHPRADELRALARRTLHRGYARHYAGFSRTLLEEYLREKKQHGAGRVKSLLYALRTALTGTHLLLAGACEVNLPRLLEAHAGFDEVRELIALKRGARRAALPADDVRWLTLASQAQERLEEARARTSLPEEAPATAELSAWLAELRLSEG